MKINRQLALCIILTGLASTSRAAPVDLDLKVGISEVCTTCNDVIRCDRDVDAAENIPAVVVYNLLEDTFWQQIATIWDYLIQFISPKTDDVRAMTIYELQTPDVDRPRVIAEQEALVDAETRRVAVPGGWIDQRSGAWHLAASGGSERQVGNCQLLDFSAGQDLLNNLNKTDKE